MPRFAETAHSVSDVFHTLYYAAAARGGTWLDTRWLGVPVLKCPLDLWVYQEILFEVRPDLIVETGTAAGGSALYLASLCDVLGAGRIVTIDIEPNADRPQHPRITQIVASSTDLKVAETVAAEAGKVERVLVILDSNHEKEHVLEEMELYSPLVTRGSYLIVEDTNVNGHPILPGFGPGPMEAVAAFLPQHPEFAPDRAREKFLMSFNPSGYLRRA